MEKGNLSKIVEPIVNWFQKNGRQDMPWRQAVTPYRVWVSEVMLQQTRIEAVVPYFLRFMQELPTIEDLSCADDEKLMKLWQGLGYYSRVRNLKRAAVEAVQTYGGLPCDKQKLLSLPGIGDYTAGAIASIAFGLPEPAVDGNVLRVLSRYLADDTDVLKPQAKKVAQNALHAIYPVGKRASYLTEGLMELGETVCVPNGKPRCEVCPLSAECLAHAQGLEEQLPVRSVKLSRTEEELTVLVIKCGQTYFLHRRPDSGLLASLWELPNFNGFATKEELAKKFNALSVQPLGGSEHIFTHKTWKMQGFLVEVESCFAQADGVWASAKEVSDRYAVPSAFRAFMKYVK